MEDTDLIARIYAYPDQYADNAVSAITSTQQYIVPEQPSQKPEEVHQSRSSRASTEPPELPTGGWLGRFPYLELRFSRGPRTSTGIIFGNDDTCDIVLPRAFGISRRHFALTYKNEFNNGPYRLVLRDLGSTFGTAVLYNNKGSEVRRNFDWILDVFDVPNTRPITLKLCDQLRFSIVVTKHNRKSPTYIENVERFRQGAATTEDLVDTLRLNSGPLTRRDTQADSPTSQPIIIPFRRLGEGGFGRVHRCWDVSTREEFACKSPRSKDFDKVAWEKELKMMKDISHEENIVRLFHWRLEPVPLMYMEYMPFGNLADANKQAPFSPNDWALILHQSASALAYLHQLPDPICHRDIKPENILVRSRNPLHIKLSDFGLSKAGDFRSCVGTEGYHAPEVILRQLVEGYYTTSADIWSLGVTILEYAYGLPEKYSGPLWITKLDDYMKKQPAHGLMNILRRMVTYDPLQRLSAKECADEALALFDLSHNPPEAPGPSFPTAGAYGARPSGLENELDPTKRIVVPPGFRVLAWNQIPIVFQPTERTINATHLLKLSAHDRSKLRKFFDTNPQMKKTVLRGGYTGGTYISLDDVSFFCDYFGLNYDAIRRLLAPAMESNTTRPVHHHEDD
ncbi:hypothetical protein ONZ43_g5215 [Nemania bipapillata]|uniref:Uncharacterized protein n=1 Tax=Nemania bipapillata TaxID=110536 RepID=A0ACC2IDB4_9PEZI|nr:hypothetical protein ONZ43_g5215 [Nemania bipapillata]